MTSRHHLFILVLILAWSRAAPARAEVSAAFELVQDVPVIFVAPANDLKLTLSAIAYDDFGRVASYTATMTSSGQAPSVVTIQSSQAADKSRTYSATRAGRPLPAPDSTRTLGFLPKDAGGLVVAAGQRLETELAYDDFGRQRVSKQKVTIDGKVIEVTFSAFTRDDFGRLKSCSGHVELRPPS